jgi:hypothetical protein
MDEEQLRFEPLRPEYLKVIRIRALILAAAATVIAGLLDLGPIRELPVAQGVAPGLVALLGLALALVMPRRRYRAWGYRLDEDELFIRAGLMVRYRTVVPFSRVQHIDVSQGPIERRYRLGRLTLHTAGTRTAAVWVPGLDYAEAERIRDLIRGRIRQEPA